MTLVRSGICSVSVGVKNVLSESVERKKNSYIAFNSLVKVCNSLSLRFGERIWSSIGVRAGNPRTSTIGCKITLNRVLTSVPFQ